MVLSENLSILKKVELFKGLSDEELEGVYRFLMPTEKRYARNQIIINQGELVEKIGIIKKGTLISTKYHFNGDAQILRIYKQGEALSLDTVSTTLLTSPVTLSSQTECRILFFPHKKIAELGEVSPNVKEIILSNKSEILSDELIRLMYKIDVLSKRTLQDRVLTYLSIIREKKGKDSFDISMNQEQLAQYLCVNRSALSKELNQMRNAGLIDYNKNRYTLFRQTGIPKKAK